MSVRVPWPNFVGPSAFSRNAVFDPLTAVNLYFEKGSLGAKAEGVFLGTPGKPVFSNIGGFPIRGLYTTGSGRCFTVMQNRLVELLSNGVGIERGLLDSFEAPVVMSDNEFELILVDGIGGYILTLSSGVLAKITDPDFPNGTKTVCFMDGAFFCPVPNSGFFRYSGVQDGFSWNSLDELSAEAVPDPLQAVVPVQGALWGLGTRSKQVFGSTGDGEVPYATIPGSPSATGCLSPFSPVVMGDRVFFLGSSNLGSPGVFVSNGYQVDRVSTPSIDSDIATWTDSDVSTALGYEQVGHSYYEISSRSGKRSHVLDVSTGLWQTRQSREPISGTMNRDIAEWHAYAFGKNLVGDYRTGKIYELSLTDFRENGEFIIRERTGGNLSMKGKRIFLTRFGLSIQAGVGSPDTCGSDADPQMMLQISYDGGKTWGVERWRSMGRVGQYKKQLEWGSGLGYGYDLVVRVRISAGVQVAIMDAWADIEVQK